MVVEEGGGDGGRRPSRKCRGMHGKCNDYAVRSEFWQRERGGVPAVPIEGHVTSEEAHWRPGWERWLRRVAHDDAGGEEGVVNGGEAVRDRVVEEGGGKTARISAFSRCEGPRMSRTSGEKVKGYCREDICVPPGGCVSHGGRWGRVSCLYQERAGGCGRGPNQSPATHAVSAAHVD